MSNIVENYHFLRLDGSIPPPGTFKSVLIEGVRRFRLALFSFLANVLGNTWEDKVIVKLPGMSIHCLGKDGRGNQYLFL